MCKILIVPKITNETRKNALRFMERMKPLMSTNNSDGLGYAAVDSTGALFGQRWHKNAASYRKVAEDKVTPLLGELAETRYYVDIAGETNSFGNVNLQDMTALTMHTRMATSGRVFENTHPFHYPDADTSLIHNGIIDNTYDFKFKVSSCDSESILISYLDAQVGLGVQQHIQAMAEKLRGYYACGVFSRDGDGNRILDVFKDGSATLYATYIQELDTNVFCTSKDDIADACSYLGFTHSDVFSVRGGAAFRFNAAGEPVETVKFKPRERWGSYYNNSPGTTSSSTTTTVASNVSKFENKGKKNKSKGPSTPEEINYLMMPPGIKPLPDYKPSQA